VAVAAPGMMNLSVGVGAGVMKAVRVEEIGHEQGTVRCFEGRQQGVGNRKGC
jgi:hypothetical protein